MREILFRGKMADNGEWAYGWYLEYPFGRWPMKSAIVPAGNAESGRLEFVEVRPGTVGQFTGLSDANGKRIFEGDILQVHGKLCEVEFDKDSARFVLTGDELYLDFIDTWGCETEVVGNIHDNPELLEGTK